MPLWQKHVVKRLEIVLFLFCLKVLAQNTATIDSSTADLSKEGSVIERMVNRVVFQNDGNSTREQHARVRVQSDAGVREYGLLRFPYQASVEHVVVSDVRVINSNGAVTTTPLDSIQDVTSEIYREAPFYTDYREKHVPVKGLEPGAILEYSVKWQSDTPLAPGQFWTSYSFLKNVVVLDEQLEIDVPAQRTITIKSQTIQPKARQENGRRIYAWKSSNLQSRTLAEQREEQGSDAYRGLLPAPDVMVSSFASWEALGRWYEGLQQDKIRPTPDVKTKAEELTKGLTNNDAKLRAIYNYVSLRYRYIGIALGIGRYQAHAAAEILGNQYGDCKDKHTLLAALLAAVGIQAYPALINSQYAIDNEVPSPSQFNHVITVVPMENKLLWMDTTPEVTPLGYLVFQLRGKPALLITPDKVQFATTPQDFPASKDEFKLTAKLDAGGTLQAHSESTFHGDDELYYRYAFRQVPESQWKDFAQRNFSGGRLGGVVTSIEVSSPEKTDEPVSITYDYTRKDFSNGDSRRFLIPISAWEIPAIKDEDLARTKPLWLGYKGESHYEVRIALPQGWSVTPPARLDLDENFAEFHETSAVKEGELVCERRIVVKANSLNPGQLESYKKFQSAVSERLRTYIYLHHSSGTTVTPATTPAQGVQRMAEVLTQIRELPDSSNPEALQAERDARTAISAKDFASAIEDLQRAVSLDPTFTRGWIETGVAEYAGTRNPKSALDAFTKAIEADPKQVVGYKILAFLQMGLGKSDDAIFTWQRLKNIAPQDSDLYANLGNLYMTTKRYAEAKALFESEVKANSSDAHAEANLGAARIGLHETEQGFEALHQAVEIDSSSEMLNNVAYILAENGVHLFDALAYSERSVKDVEEQSKKLDLEKIEKSDRELPLRLAACWDTLGWIYFKTNNLPSAERFVTAAWQLFQDGTVADHLGQVYEKEHKPAAALHMYNLALEVNPRLEDVSTRMRNLAQVPLPKNRMSAQDELSWMRTVRVPATVKDSVPVNADIDVSIVAGAISQVHFASGIESLRGTEQALLKADFRQAFPPDSTAHVYRKGMLSCTKGGCNFVFFPATTVAKDN
jgi:tetratricopeptide (TPR) repeat protein/transglutaminase-like putative cysteine protease